MTITSRHSKVSGKSDGLDTTLVQPSDWNDDHDIKCDQNKILGRVSSGNGLVEEIDCTAFARTVLAAATAAAAWALIKQAVLLTDINLTGGTALTAPAVGDELALYDLSATANKKILLSDLFKVIDGLTAKTTPVAADEVAIYDVAGVAAKKVALSDLAASVAFKAPTRTYLTSGTAQNYATKDGCKKLIARWIGAGAGGGSNANSGNSGSAGGDTTFNSVAAKGGSGGTSGSLGGLGGTGGSGSADLRLAGGAGATRNGGADGNATGGSGGCGFFGGGGRGATDGATSSAGSANTGGGGGGGGDDNGIGGGGGGSGEYCELTIDNPTGNYVYTVGAGGAGGSGTSAGSAGGSGLIIIEEYY